MTNINPFEPGSRAALVGLGGVGKLQLALEDQQALGGRDEALQEELTSVSNLAEVLQYQGKYEAAEKMNRSVLNERKKALGEEHPDTLKSVSNLAMVLRDQGKYEVAEEMNRLALHGRENQLGGEHPDTLTSVSNLAVILHDQGRYEAAEGMNGRALCGREKVLGREHPDTLMSINNLAVVLQDQGKYETAEPMIRRALEGRETTLGKEHADTLTSVSNLALVLQYLKKYEAAEGMNRRALDGREKTLGEEHPSTLMSISNLAFVLREQGKYEAAEEMDRWALEGRKKTLGEEHPDTLTSFSNLAVVLQDRGKYEAAEETSRRALDGYEKTLGDEHPSTLTSVSNLAVVLQNQGKYKEAGELTRRALEGRELALGKKHPDTLTSASNLAKMLRFQGKDEVAKEINRRALRRRDAALGKEHLDTPTSASNLESVHCAQGMYQATENMHQRLMAKVRKSKEELVTQRPRVAEQNATEKFAPEKYAAEQYAILADSKERAKHLLEACIGVDADGGEYYSALQAASCAGHETVVERLLRAGADVNAQGGYYGNALQAASNRGHEKIVEKLLAAGANVNAQGGEYGSALEAARVAGNEKVVDRLLAAGVGFTHSAQSGKLWERAALNHTYKDVWRLVQDIESADLRESTICLKFEYEVPAVISLAESQLGSKKQHLIDDMLRNHVVLVKRTARDGNSDQLLGLEALTCLEYMSRRWSVLGEQVLKEISVLCNAGVLSHRTYKTTQQSKTEYALTAHDSYLSVNINNAVLDHELDVVISALDWLCKAFRIPQHLPLQRGCLVSSSCCRISYLETKNATIGYDSSKSGICLDFSLSTEPMQELEHNCWQQLFHSCFVLEEKELSRYHGTVGKGLEMSFDLMVSLAATEYPVIVKDTVFLTGYRTVLVPTQLEADYVQFHLEVNERQQINPFNLKSGERAPVTDYTQFKSKRCFVGWCETAQITLGTQRLPLTVRYSGAQEQRRTLHMTGVSAGGHIGSAAPIQAGVSGQATFSFISHHLAFSPASEYSKMLFDVSKQVVLISDVTARRSWLVSKLSLILHMAHAWVIDNGIAQDTSSDPIPFADPHDDGIAVRQALECHGDTAVCGHGNDLFRLRSLLLGLSINLLATVNLTERSRHNSLYGFEFMDIVSEPGRGAFMKRVKVGTDQSWLPLANLADAVIICSDIGEAITPAEGDSRKNSMCNALPPGRDYLAAHLSCLVSLARRAGRELVLPLQDPRIALSREKFWTIIGEPFEACTHGVQSTDTCWTRGHILQEISQTNFLPSLFKLERNPSPCPQKFCLNGAVVFGEHFDDPAA